MLGNVCKKIPIIKLDCTENLSVRFLLMQVFRNVFIRIIK